MTLLKRILARKDRATAVNKFLFILSPPYCGSTLLSQIIGSSTNVSVNNCEGTREGQTLPQVRDMMFVERRWDEKLSIDWNFVRDAWLQHWDMQKPILLEKSPPNLIRALEIERKFDPAYFIILWRNPYAHCESQMRRNGNTPKQAAGFAVRCLQKQKENIERLANTLPVSYEDLTSNPDTFESKAREFLVDLGSLNTSGQFNVHNLHEQNLSIRNLNEEKISLLADDHIHQINSVLSHHTELLDYFGYEIIRVDDRNNEFQQSQA